MPSCNKPGARTEEPVVGSCELVSCPEEEFHRTGSQITLNKRTLLDLRSASDSKACGNQMVCAGAIHPLGVRTSQQVPRRCAMSPDSGSTDSLRRYRLQVGKRFTIAVSSYCGETRVILFARV